MEGSRRRALIAAAIGLLGAAIGIAGVGHAYLRRWRRAIAWFLLVIAVGIVLVSVYTDPADVTPAEMPLEVTLPLLALLLLSAFDAYIVARDEATAAAEPAAVANAQPDAEVASCPHCGRDLDPELDFCHWCTRPLDRSHEE